MDCYITLVFLSIKKLMLATKNIGIFRKLIMNSIFTFSEHIVSELTYRQRLLLFRRKIVDRPRFILILAAFATIRTVGEGC
jgi:hypothetical protein